MAIIECRVRGGWGGEGVDFLRGRVLVSAWDSYADYLNDHPVKY